MQHFSSTKKEFAGYLHFLLGDPYPNVMLEKYLYEV